MNASAGDPLDLTLREVLARVLAERTQSTDAGAWIDCADSAACPIPWRRVLEAAQRGELEASRVGRRVLVRRVELDRWIASKQIKPRARATDSPQQPASRVAHLISAAGYRRVSGEQ
jgi:excisionase family DNA binding protein